MRLWRNTSHLSHQLTSVTVVPPFQQWACLIWQLSSIEHRVYNCVRLLLVTFFSLPPTAWVVPSGTIKATQLSSYFLCSATNTCEIFSIQVKLSRSDQQLLAEATACIVLGTLRGSLRTLHKEEVHP